MYGFSFNDSSFLKNTRHGIDLRFHILEENWPKNFYADHLHHVLTNKLTFTIRSNNIIFLIKLFFLLLFCESWQSYYGKSSIRKMTYCESRDTKGLAYIVYIISRRSWLLTYSSFSFLHHISFNALHSVCKVIIYRRNGTYLFKCFHSLMRNMT